MHSFKKEIISHFQTLPKIEGLEKNKLVVYTAAGTFVGTPVFEEDAKDQGLQEIIYNLTIDVAKDYRSENNIPDGQMLDDNDGCFLLSNVTLITGQTRSNIPILAMFYDQIIGISVGNIS